MGSLNSPQYPVCTLPLYSASQSVKSLPRMDLSTSHRFCILGAGTSGLTVAKNFLQEGISFDCLEREDDLGGNWNFGKPCSSVYASTHLISSKRQTEYTDYPMPATIPNSQTIGKC